MTIVKYEIKLKEICKVPKRQKRVNKRKKKRKFISRQLDIMCQNNSNIDKSLVIVKSYQKFIPTYSRTKKVRRSTATFSQMCRKSNPSNLLPHDSNKSIRISLNSHNLSNQTQSNCNYLLDCHVSEHSDPYHKKMSTQSINPSSRVLSNSLNLCHRIDTKIYENKRTIRHSTKYLNMNRSQSHQLHSKSKPSIEYRTIKRVESTSKLHRLSVCVKQQIAPFDWQNLGYTWSSQTQKIMSSDKQFQ